MHAFQACALNRSAISPPFAGRPAGAKQTGCLISRARLKGKLIPAAARPATAGLSILPAKQIDTGKNQTYETSERLKSADALWVFNRLPMTMNNAINHFYAQTGGSNENDEHEFD
jgi:hypothetical protein